jgi:hypothetical protein
MKKIILLLVMVLSLMSFKSNTAEDFNIVGKWKGEDGKGIGFCILQEDGYAYLELEGKIFGGKEFLLKDQKASMTYKIEKSEDFLFVDIIVTKMESGESKALLCLIEVVNANKFKMTIGFNGVRPDKFVEENTVVFNRVQKK